MARQRRSPAEPVLVAGKSDKLPVGQLVLDAENPRLASAEPVTGQDELVKALWQQMAVDEVALSIAANGYFPDEPLLVIPGDPRKPSENGKFLIVEGNRRFAAVLLLLDEELRIKVKATDLPQITPERRRDLETLPVVKYEKRRDLWTYCGFRHINGIQPWDAFSKAKYVTMVHEKYGYPLEVIAGRIGDRHTTVKRLYRGYKVLEQAESQAGFDPTDRVRNRFYFSHLYTALDQPDFQKHLGIEAETSLRPNPVPKSRLSQLKELMTWLYGSKSRNTEPLVRNQYPDLNTLRDVISKPASLSALRSGYPLARAYEISIGDRRRFRDSLTKAKEELQQAKGTVTTGYAGEQDLSEIMSDILRVASSLEDEMKQKRQGKPSGE